MHWTAGFRLGYISNIIGPPPVSGVVSSKCMDTGCANQTARRVRRTALGLCVLIIAVVGVWSAGLLAGRPALPLAGSGGTDRVFAANEGRVLAAITNAFGGLKYNQMMLIEAVGEDWLAEGWHPTNGLLLLPTLEPVAWIPTKGILGRRRLPYMAWFQITALPE